MIQREEILKLFEQIEEKVEDMDDLLTVSIHQEKEAGFQSIEKQKNGLWTNWQILKQMWNTFPIHK